MMPTVVVLLLVLLAVAAVIWSVRRSPPHKTRPDEDQDTAWNDPITPADEGEDHPRHLFHHEPRP